MRDTWDKWAEEPARAYRAFCGYLNMPPNERGVLKAYRQFVSNPYATAPTPEYTAWKKKYDWEERAAAYDEHVEKERRRAVMEGIKIAAIKQGEEVHSVNYKIIEAAGKIADRIIEMADTELDEMNWNAGQMGPLLRAVIQASEYTTGVTKEAENQDGEKTGDDLIREELKKLGITETDEGNDDDSVRDTAQGSPSGQESEGSREDIL